MTENVLKIKLLKNIQKSNPSWISSLIANIYLLLYIDIYIMIFIIISQYFVYLI